MKFLKQNKYILLLRIALGVSIIAIGYLTTMFYFQMRDLDASFDSIENANAGQTELNELFSILNKDEIMLSSLIITDSASVDEALFNRREALEKITQLKEISKEKMIFDKDILVLETLVERKYALLEEIVAIIHTNPFNERELHTSMYQKKAIDDQLNNFLENDIMPKISGLKLQNKNYTEKITNSRNTVMILALVSIFIFLLSYNRMNDNLLALKKINGELKILNETFKSAEKIAGFGYWKINMETNRYTFSDNFYRLLEQEIGGFIPNMENFLKFIHPDDYQYVLKTHHDSEEQQIPTSILYRYVLPSGTLKYVISASNFSTNAKGETLKIGVIHDVTEQFKKTFELEENNKKLIAINAELESFNNIASHDLQEPLRKIQMFISRLESNDLDKISDEGKNYFSKIKLSANRMQNLMIDLVNYSRTIKSDKILTHIDLNTIVQETLEEINQTIEETKANIHVSRLPCILGTKFQIQQLFMNLISNSLKYTKPNQPPKISITTEEIFVDDLLNSINEKSDKIITNKDYYKIIVVDNGIGFNPEYSQKIFQLFRRLETQASYAGTGLGLAICKKIIENHNGFIKAEGRTGQGATFIIYLPKDIDNA